MGSTKVIMTLWVRQNKPIKPLIELGPDDLEDAQDTEGNTGDKRRPALPVNPSPQEMGKNSILGLYDSVKKTLKSDAENQKETEENTNLTAHKNEEAPNDNYTMVEMPFNSLMREFFESSDISELIQRMLAHIRTQVENSRMPESAFTLNKIMYLYINFHSIVLTRGGYYTELPKWIKSKKAVTNPLNNDQGCFKWAVTAALHYKEIKHHPERISLLHHHEDQYN